MIKKISELLFDLFVINRKAIAVQQSDGTYKTKYVSITSNDILCMLEEKKSLGTYQQLYKSPFLKWICFDFDCKDDKKPNLNELYNDCIKPLNEYLKKQEIHYVNEFSGRRGIHVWVIFDKLIEKQLAYSILTEILDEVHISYNTEKYGLDKFPSTANCRGNIVGKQVKIPLSTHKKGRQSFLFFDKFDQSIYLNDFNLNQLSILSEIKVNSVDRIIDILGIKRKEENLFKKLYLPNKLEIEVSKAIEILSETKVYEKLFHRFQLGQSNQIDWFVLLGTFGKISDSHKFLLDILKYSPNFSEEETSKNIKKFNNKYFPATFSYLYKLYGLDIEQNLDPDQTGLEYLVRRIDKKIDLQEWKISELNSLDTCEYTIKKEINYLFTNDEVPNISTYLDLCYFTKYDISRLNTLIEKICCGEIKDYKVENISFFLRLESPEKTRQMISLSATDRVLTTHLALKLSYNLAERINSFSYNPNFISHQDIFFHWFKSWENYLSSISRYIELELYENLGVITIDIKHFYDSIDFLGVYKLLKNSLSGKNQNIMEFLINYNEHLMQSITDSRIGVPQGPAYARIIAELFLSILIDIIKKEFAEHNDNITVLRYVDDIIIFNNSQIPDQVIYDKFASILGSYGLLLNLEKSKIYGKIKELSLEDKELILRKNQFQYELRENKFSYLLSDDSITTSVKKVLFKNPNFDINDINYYFSRSTDKRAKKEIFYKYYENIFSCIYGRGSTYSLFYNYLLVENELIEFSLKNNAFFKIPLNTINFSCFLTSLYLLIKEEKILPFYKTKIIENYITSLKMDDLDKEEDKTIVSALINKEKNER